MQTVIEHFFSAVSLHKAIPIVRRFCLERCGWQDDEANMHIVSWHYLIYEPGWTIFY